MVMRSTGHTDAHYGALEVDGTVDARCGGKFRPQQEMFGSVPLVLCPPVDLERCCSQCQTAADRGQATEGAVVAGTGRRCGSDTTASHCTARGTTGQAGNSPAQAARRAARGSTSTP